MSYKVTFGKVKVECDTFDELQKILDYEAARTAGKPQREWSEQVRKEFKIGLPEVTRKLIKALEDKREGVAASDISEVVGKPMRSPGPLFVSIYGGLKKFGVSDPKSWILKERREGKIFYKLSDRYFSND